MLDNDEVRMSHDVGMINSGNQRSSSKRVRIAPEPQILCCVETLDELTAQDRNEAWWQKEEFASNIKLAKKKCKSIRSTSDPGTCLEDAFNIAGIMASSGLDLDLIHQAQVLKPNMGLVQWCSSQELRGLERLICKTHSMMRGKLMQDVKSAVFSEQSRQLAKNERNSEALARTAELASLKSRALAALLGQADAAAVQPKEAVIMQPARMSITEASFTSARKSSKRVAESA